jgi:hypothetical protein
MHELTKTQAKAAEGHVQSLAKKWDEKLAQLITSIAEVIADKAKQAVELKANMVGHQAFRAGFCSQKECTELLGEGTYNTLNKTFLAIREPPMRAWMTSQELLTKVGEHAKRTAQYVSMLPALLKKAEKDTSKSEGELKSMIGQIQQDAKAVSDAKNGKLFAPATVNKIKNVEKDLKAPKLDEKGWKKLEIFVLGYERDLKQRNSELKTLGILTSGAPKKAGVYAQDTTIKNLIKQMDTDFKEMTKLATDIEKETLAVRKVYDQIGKQFK